MDWGKLLGSLLQGAPTAIVIGLALVFFIQPVSTRVDQVETRIGGRLDQLVAVMNREVIPIINDLKKGMLPGPEIKPLAALSQRLDDVLSSLETQVKTTRAVQLELKELRSSVEAQKKKVEAIELAAQDVRKNQETAARESQHLRASIVAALDSAKEQSVKAAEKFEGVHNQLEAVRAALDENRKVALGAAVGPYLGWRSLKTYQVGDVIDPWVDWSVAMGQAWPKKIGFKVIDAASFNHVISEWNKIYVNKLGLTPVEITERK